MSKARVFLRTELFTCDGADGHVPRGTSIIDGTLGDGFKGGLTVVASAYFDVRGKALEGPAAHLFLPMSKVDHVQLAEEP